MQKSVAFESFEARRLMSVVPVTNTNDAGAGSLRAAVAAAMAGDTIDLRSVTGTISLSTAQINIERDVSIVGPGSSNLDIQGSATGRVFVVASGTNVTISNVTLSHGDTDTSGGAILSRGTLALNNVVVSDSHSFLFGGGVYSAGPSLTLNDCTFENNTVSGALEASGGAVYMEGGTLTVNRSTFTGNNTVGKSNSGLTSGPAYGGAMFLHNTLDSTITNSTFGDNSATGGTGGVLANNGQAFGGAIATNTSAGTLLNHVTVAFNDATGGGALLAKANSQGGGVYSMGTGVVTLAGSIVAQNAAMNSPDVLNRLLSTLGDNVIGIYSGSTLLNGILGDLLGTTLAPVAPGLTPLANNGGMTMTYGLLDNSPAVNTGGTDAPLLDQRGFGRRDAADSGAFELDANHLPAIAAPSTPAIAGVVFNQPLAVVDGDNDLVTVTSNNLPNWLTIQTLNGVPTLVGLPSELDAGTYDINLDAFDGFQHVTLTTRIKVGIPGIDLSPTGLLRLNGTDFDDELYITLGKNDTIKVFRDGFKRSFPAASVTKIQIFGFGGRDNILVDVGKVRANIFAGDGNDTVQSGAGADNIYGQGGDDKLMGGFGRDRVNGDDGRDSLFGEAGEDTIHGGAGRDRIDGGIGRNYLFGDEGNDIFNALLGTRDVIYGGEGTNTGIWDKNDYVIDSVLG